MLVFVPSFGISVALLVCISVIVTETQSATTKPPSTTKKSQAITYTCAGGKVVPSTISVQNGQSTNLRVMTKDGNFCTDTTGDYLKKCINSVYATNATIFKIVYEDEQNREIIGGQNAKIFELTCTEKAGKMMVEASVTNVLLTSIPAPRIGPNSTANPTMKIENIPANIYIGDEIKLKIEVKGNYKLKPLSCLAHKERLTDGYTFWDLCDTSATDQAIIKDSGWTKVDDTRRSFTADIFAFRFASDNTVHITCSVYVCPGGDAGKCDSDGCPVERRKRNSMNLLKSNPLPKSSKKVATVSFKVQSYTEQSNSALGLWYRNYRYMVIAWVVCWTISGTR